MDRIAIVPPARLVPIDGAGAPDLDEIGFCAWVAAAEPGDTLVYHRGFLAVETHAIDSTLPVHRQLALRQLAAAAWRAAEQELVHLVQARIDADQFAYIAIARPKPRRSRAALSTRLLESRAA